MDKQGRPRLFHNGQEMCNNFNQPKGCYRSLCNLFHVCASCHVKDHGSINCRKNSKGSQQRSNANVPSGNNTSESKSK